MYEQLGTHETTDPATHALGAETLPRLGNPELPVAASREQIITTVAENQVTIITAATGAGKTTQVPQMLLESGLYEKIYVTQPRVVAARSVAERVREELVSALGPAAERLVGYRTREEGDSTPDNMIQFCTDGLQLTRMLRGNGPGAGEVLVVDEIHEWNPNHSLIIALAKERMKTDPTFKLVIMSATMDAEPLAQFFSDSSGNPAPILDIPGRTFPIEERVGGKLVDEVVNYAKEGRNTLTFVPGKQEIEATIGRLRRQLGNTVEVLALHGDQTPEEQRRVFRHYDKPVVVVATNIAQTSITVPDMDAVVSCGWERTNNIRDGVEGLHAAELSASSLDQQRGRVGRTKPGIFCLATLDDYPPPSPRDGRTKFDSPGLNRKRPDAEIIKLMQAGYDVTKLEFFHPLKPEAITEARQRLLRIGALAIHGNFDTEQLTKEGKEMSTMAMEPNLARMVVEAKKYGTRVLAQMLAMAAIVESNGITAQGVDTSPRWRKLTTIDDSDMLRELEIFTQALQLREEELARHDIVARRFDKALTNYKLYCEQEGIDEANLWLPSMSDKEALLRSIASGADYLLRGSGHHGQKGRYTDPLGRERLTPKNSCLEEGSLIIGIPFDTTNIRGGVPKYGRTINFASKIPGIEWLIHNVPRRVQFAPGEFYMHNGKVYERQAVLFDGANTKHTVDREATGSRALHEFLLYRLIDGALYVGNSLQRVQQFKSVIDSFYDLADRSTCHIDTLAIIQRIVHESVSAISKDAKTLEEMSAYLPALSLDTLIHPTLQRQILSKAPDYVHVAGERMPVRYQSGAAIITIPQEGWSALPDSFKHALGANRRVLIEHPHSKELVTLSDARRIAGGVSRQRLRARNGVAESLPYYHQGAARRRRTREPLLKLVSQV